MEGSADNALAEAYRKAASADASRVFRLGDEKSNSGKYHALIHETHTNKPIVWAIPNLCTRDEYDLLLQQAECPNLYDKDVSETLRVKDIFDEHGGMEPLSDALLPRLQHEYNRQKAWRGNNEDVSDQVDAVSPKWRVLKLNVDEEFPAHRDAMDSVHDQDGNFAVSTHSVLLDFQEGSKGGAIRLYYRRYPWDSPYEYSVDVHLPKGWALVVEQRPDLWYALQSMQPFHEVQQHAPVRYVAQAGMLQTLQQGETAEELRRGCSSTFALAPGLFAFMEDEIERCHGEYRGWGEHAVNPKSTLWKAGRPIVPDKPDESLLRRPQSNSGLLCEGNHDNEQRGNHANTTKCKKPIRRQSLTAQVDPIRGSVAYVEGRRPTIPKTVPTRRQPRASLHSSMPALMIVGGDQSTVGRERVHRRLSLQAPVRAQDSCVLPQAAAHKVHHFNGDDSLTSFTADFSMSESYRSAADDLVPVPSHQNTKGRRHSVGVTRQPRKDSMVGKLMSAFQTSKATMA